MSKALRDLGTEIPPKEDTPFVRKLVAIIEQLVELEKLVSNTQKKASASLAALVALVASIKK
jgi:hypothetical protein